MIDPQLFSNLGLDKSDQEIFVDVFQRLNKVYPVENIDLPVFDIEVFDILKTYNERALIAQLKLDEDRSIIIIEVSHRHAAKNGIRTVYEYQAWGIVKMKRNFGHVVIKPEGFTEKLLELVKPVELDFEEDRAFSKKFYVLTKDKSRAAEAINQPFRNLLMNTKLKNLLLEINGQSLIAGTAKNLDAEDVLGLAAFIKAASAIR